MSDLDISTVDLRQVAFTSEIRRIAATLGREPTAEQATALESVMRQSAVLGEGNRVEIITDCGAVPVTDYIAKSLAHLPLAALPANAEPPTVTRPVEPLFSRGRNDFFANLTRGFAAAEQAASLKEALKGPNPWGRGHENRTRQTVITNLNPELAAEMKMKAGAV